MPKRWVICTPASLDESRSLSLKLFINDIMLVDTNELLNLESPKDQDHNGPSGFSWKHKDESKRPSLYSPIGVSTNFSPAPV